jgi:two-component system LytT family response regulator
MKKILIVEDETGIREALKEILEFSGYNVITATNGKEGFKEIIDSNPDLVLCDVNMPELNGYELLGVLGQRFSSELLPPFIFITANVDKEDIRQGMNLGADDYLTKPFDHNQLLRIVKMRLEKREKLVQSPTVTVTASQAATEQDQGIKNLFELNKLAIPTLEGLELIDFKQIIRCEADRAYCKFFLVDKTRLVVSKPLKEFEEILISKNFLRIHKSHIVNLIHIEKYVKGVSGHVIMSDSSTIPVSTRKKDEVLNKLNQG